jgi:NAD(P)-dependent dehydrogenase (short-subunit alcohol dehydrogenase family)
MRALVTGGSRGIGRGIALALAERGASVAGGYVQNDTAARATLDGVREHGSEGLLVQADVRRPDEIERMLDVVKTELGALDIFVSNARPELADFFQPPSEITLEQWDARSTRRTRSRRRRRS